MAPVKAAVPADKDKTVHRPLSLTSPILRGADIGALQSNVNQRFEKLKIECEVAVDDELGPQTLAAAEWVALCMGVTGDGQDKLKRNTVSEGIQKLIRGGRNRTKDEVAAGKKREKYRQELRKQFSKSSGERAIEKSAGLLGVHEEPSGSNWGGKVEEMIKFTGYSEPVFWCGCCAAWIVIKIGGAKIPSKIRFGYAGYILADALAGANGLTAVPAASCRAGDVGTLWGAEHIVTVRGPARNGMVPTREGNTSSASGSQSNGGEVADKERPLSDFDRGVVARPTWG
jgi:hypothetical protein